ncbi:2-keto-4-pentenoate hydratase [Antarcticirhabdus aurantiaca]|uniref:2-keto-4-pentenoate hydratase n=1 Tax=Antarcticirhabdus aurantiaca TaxID=2606717 RepID=UPI00131E15E1|nr:2-keto-4-pentenoate hydratase [Antarcticirhabdus aurantiaca]
MRIAEMRNSGARIGTLAFGWAPALAEANGIQFLETPAGTAWKVARSPEGTPVVSELHPFVAEGDALTRHEGALLEIEVAVTLRRDLPVRTGEAYTRAEILDAVGEFRVGAELVRSVFLENGKVSFPLFVADRMGNDGYLLGPLFDRDHLDDIQRGRLKLELEGVPLFDADAKHGNGDCLGWLVDFANLDARLVDPLAVGACVTTGSLCGAVAIPGPGHVEVGFGNGFAFGFDLVEPTGNRVGR